MKDPDLCIVEGCEHVQMRQGLCHACYYGLANKELSRAEREEMAALEHEPDVAIKRQALRMMLGRV